MMEMMRERSARGGASSSINSTSVDGGGGGALHNFSTPPYLDLRWGYRKPLIFVKDPPDAAEHGSPSDSRKRRSPSSDDNKCVASGIDVVRKKLMTDLRNEVYHMKASLISTEDHSPAADATAEDARPWNLRTRRAVCKEPNEKTGVSDRIASFSPGRVKSPVRTHHGEEVEEEKQQRPRAKFVVSLSKQEIEADFLAITGCRPARRPKKRPSKVQKQLDLMFPGYWLSEITADMYKVNEQMADGGKR